MIFALSILILVCLALACVLFVSSKKLKEKDIENIRLQAVQKARGEAQSESLQIKQAE